MRNYFYYVEFM